MHVYVVLPTALTDVVHGLTAENKYWNSPNEKGSFLLWMTDSSLRFKIERDSVWGEVYPKK